MPRDWSKDPLPDNDDLEAMLDLQDEIDRLLVEDGVIERATDKASKGAFPSAGYTSSGSNATG